MTGCRPHGKNGGFFWQRTFKRFRYFKRTVALHTSGGSRCCAANRCMLARQTSNASCYRLSGTTVATIFVIAVLSWFITPKRSRKFACKEQVHAKQS